MKQPLVSTQVYFDCNATTPVLPAAADAAMETMRTLYGNPSSPHLIGLQAKSILEATRKKAGKLIGTEPEQVIFTSGATEAIQTAVFSALHFFREKCLNQKGLKLLYGATEHKAVPQALHHWVKALQLPLEIVELPVDSNGQIHLETLGRELKQAILLCTMAVNNETGVIQDLSAIESLLKETQSPALWLVDYVQALGKSKIHLNSTRIDYATLSGHKVYAPKGIGILYVRKGAPFTPLIVGGGQEKGYRSGTENLPGIAALGAVFDELLKSDKNSKKNKYKTKKTQPAIFHSHAQLLKYRQRLVSELKHCFPNIEFNTPFDYAVPTTINFSIPGYRSSELLDLFDSAGLRLSAGSACNSASVKPSHVLDAMKIPHWRSISALRLSFGPYTSEVEINRGCKILRQCSKALSTTRFNGILQLRSGSTNSWIFVDPNQRQCIIVDPCEEIIQRIESYVQGQNLKVVAILDTHSHADHESIRPILQKNLKKYLKSLGPDLGHNRGHNLNHDFDSLGWPDSPSQPLPLAILDHGETVPYLPLSSSKEGDWVIARLETPGHTTDSLTYLVGTLTFEKKNLKKPSSKAFKSKKPLKLPRLEKENIRFAFCGDMILSGGLGRTNFQNSDPVALFHSLRKLQTVIDDRTLLCPAHDYNNSFATNLGTEYRGNPLLALALGSAADLALDTFLQKKEDIDRELLKLEETFQEVVCGVTPASAQVTDPVSSISTEHLRDYLINKKGQSLLVVDVREPQEYALFKEWNTIGLNKIPKNVPLSGIVNFMAELLTSKKQDQEILFLCKTGTRSSYAAQSLRRLGFHRVWNIKGGFALSSCQD